MTKQLSTETLAAWEKDSVTSDDAPLYLLKFTAANYNGGEPLLVVPDHEDFVSRGETYRAFALQLSLPADDDRQKPQLAIVLGNASRVLMGHLIRSELADSQVEFEVVRRSAPDTVEYSAKFFVDEVTADQEVIRVGISKAGLYDLVGVRIQHTPERTPGIF